MEIIVSGIVLHGDGYGRKLGFPTANLDRRQFVRLKDKVKLGVYAGIAQLPSGKIYKAAMVIGPLDSRGLPKIEAHLLGFDGNLYGKRLTYHFKKYIRAFKKYSGEENLRKQIARDVRIIKQLKLKP